MTRLVAIARELRDILKSMDRAFEIWFLTTSEAPQIAHEFPVFKLPSKTILRQSEGGQRAYASIAKLMISNLIASFRPDALVLDTIPEGSFKEFLFIKDHAQRCFFIYRERSEARSRSFQSHLNLYHRILIPESSDADGSGRFPLSETLRRKARFLGRSHGFDPERALSREQVRKRFAVPEASRLIYVAAGGGGDPTASKALHQIMSALKGIPDLFILIGLGPLYRGPGYFEPGQLSITETEVSQYFPGVDLAISAAGYNSYEELLAARVSTLFFAQEKGLDQQEKRIRLGFRQEYHGWLKTLDPAEIRSAVDQALHGEVGIKWQDRLLTREFQTGSIHGAVEILDGLSALSQLDLDRDALFFHGHIQKVLKIEAALSDTSNPGPALAQVQAPAQFTNPSVQSRKIQGAKKLALSAMCWSWIQTRIESNDSSDMLAKIRLDFPHLKKTQPQLNPILKAFRECIEICNCEESENQPNWLRFFKNFDDSTENTEKTLRIFQTGVTRFREDLDAQSLSRMIDWWNQSVPKSISIAVWNALLDRMDNREPGILLDSRSFNETLGKALDFFSSIAKQPGPQHESETRV